MLCSSIVDDLLQIEQGKDVVTFFVATEVLGGMDTALYLLDSLIYQLVRKGQRTGPIFKLLSIQKTIHTIQPPMSTDVFRHYLVTILGTLEPNDRLVVTLDGLQTEEWIMNAFVYEILEANILRTKANLIRCIVTSKNPHSVISHDDQIGSIDLGCQVGVQHDLFVFAKARLALFPQPMTEDGSYMETRARQLCMRANGSFLWVQIVTEHQDRNGELEETLENIGTLPSSLQEVYAVMLQKVPAWRTSVVQIIFSWLLAGIRPLKLGELLEALVIESDRHPASVSEAYARERLDLQDPRIDIPQMCGGLVRTSQSYFYFAVFDTSRKSCLRGTRTLFLLRPVMRFAF